MVVFVVVVVVVVAVMVVVAVLFVVVTVVIIVVGIREVTLFSDPGSLMHIRLGGHRSQTIRRNQRTWTRVRYLASGGI